MFLAIVVGTVIVLTRLDEMWDDEFQILTASLNVRVLNKTPFTVTFWDPNTRERRFNTWLPAKTNSPKAIQIYELDHIQNDRRITVSRAVSARNQDPVPVRHCARTHPAEVQLRHFRPRTREALDRRQKAARTKRP